MKTYLKKYIKKIIRIQNKDGFSLIEMIVAVTLFAVLMLYVVGIMQLTFVGQANAIARQNIEESMRYAFESMSKELRMAQLSDNACAGNAGSKKLFKYSGGNGLTFLNIYGQCVNYSVPTSGANVGRLMVNRTGTALPITPNDIFVNNLNVSFDDFDLAGGQRGRVTIKMDVANANGKEINLNNTTFQLTVSSRYYDQDNE